MRVAIYARVSTDDQVEKYGLPVQLRACRDLVARNNWPPATEFAEEEA